MKDQAEALLQPAKRTPPKTSRTKDTTHNELRTKRRMW
jgi:hypothetical protein